MRSQRHKHGVLGTQTFENSDGLSDNTTVIGTSVVGNPAADQVAGAPPSSGGGSPAPSGAKVTASVTKTPAAPDDTGTITFAGGPADKAYVVTVVVKDSTDAADVTVTANIAVGNTATAAATALVAAWPSGTPAASKVTVSRSTKVVTLTPTTGGTIEKLTVNIP